MKEPLARDSLIREKRCRVLPFCRLV